MSIDTLWHAQLVVSLLLTGLIFTIQIVHYPTFKFIDSSKFQAFHHFHSSRISTIVAPLMVLELILSGWVFLVLQNTFSLAGLALVALIWSITFFVSVPIHNKLSGGFQKILIQKLILTNWLRTLLWTIKFLMMSTQLP